jgi:hypothetical protein
VYEAVRKRFEEATAEYENIRHGFKAERSADCALRYHVPLPLDHFFFCFLPPVAAGACQLVSACPCSLMPVDIPCCRMCGCAEVFLSPS